MPSIYVDSGFTAMYDFKHTLTPEEPLFIIDKTDNKKSLKSQFILVPDYTTSSESFLEFTVFNDASNQSFTSILHYNELRYHSIESYDVHDESYTFDDKKAFSVKDLIDNMDDILASKFDTSAFSSNGDRVSVNKIYDYQGQLITRNLFDGENDCPTYLYIYERNISDIVCAGGEAVDSTSNQLYLAPAPLFGESDYREHLTYIFFPDDVVSESGLPWASVASTITSVYFLQSISPTSIAFWFSGCANGTSATNWTYLNTSNVTNMNSAFKNCTGFNLNVSHGNTSNVTDMSFMFYHCTHQNFNPDVSNGDISQVTTLQSMFDGCTGNNFNPDFSNGDTSSVTTTEGMFYGCNGNSFNPNVRNGNTSNIINARYMFAYNSGTSFNPNVSNGDVSNLVNTEYMFRNCSELTKLDLHNGNLTALETSTGMFFNCTKLKTIYCNYTGSAASSTYMFSGCSSLIGGNGTIYSASNIDITYAKLDESGSSGYFTKGAVPIDANHLHFSTGDDTPAGRMQIVNGGQLYYEEETGDGIYEGGASDYSSINVNTLENLFIVTNPDSFLNDTSAFLDFLESTGGSSNYFNEMTNLLRSVSPYQAPDCGAYKLTYSFTIPSQNGQVSGTIYIKRTDIISQTFGIGSGYDVQEFSTCSHTHTSSRTYFFDYCEGSGAGACDTDCNCGCEAYVCYDCGGIYPIAGYSCECGDDGTNYLNTGIDPTALPHGSTQLPTTAVAPHTLRQTQINGLYSESYGYVYNNGTEYLDNKSEDFIEVPRQIEDPLNTGPTLLDLLYPIGTYILGDNPYFTPIEKFGGNWTNLSSFYNYRYLGLGGPCMSATSGGSDLSSISYTPAGTVASVTLKPADCNVASGTALSSYGNIGSKTYSSTSFAYSHSHTFPKPVCKSISAASGSPVAYRKTAISGTSTYIEATSANHATYKLNHQSMQVATTGLTFTNAHNHSVPAIAAANATSGHTHTFTGTAQTLNLNPLAKCVQIGRRDG